MDIRIATGMDDAAIRELMQQIPLNGKLRIRYLKEPSYFASLELQGTPQQTLAGLVNNEIMAVGSRNLQKLYINGEIKTAGYISNLRYHPVARHGISLLKGIRHMENLPASKTTDFHYATLISTDKANRQTLVANRPRMPRVFDIGGVNTYAIQVKKKADKPKPFKRFEIVKGDGHLMPAIMTFLKKEGMKKDFFPVLDGGSYAKELLTPVSFFAIYDQGSLAGVCSIPDMSKYRQYIMEGYARSFALLRVPLNIYYDCRGLSLIPGKGKNIYMTRIGFPVIKDENAEVFSALLSHVHSYLSGSGQHFLTVALHENSPLNKSVKLFPKITYKSRLYVVKLLHDKFTAFEEITREMTAEWVKSGEELINTNVPFIDFLRL